MRAGEAAAFEELYERHVSGLLSFCRHMLGSQEEAEDAVQHTFLAAHKALLADDREIHLKAWLYAIARNRCLSMLRSRRERVGYDDELEGLPSTAGLSSEVEQREDLRSLLGDLAKLPDEQRSALLLSELGAHSHDDVAEVLGVKREKVKALVFQAREGLSAARTARETPCGEIREQLSTARGGALRRGNLRRHLEACAGCRAFRDEVQRQRVAFSAILPVVPGLALKQAVLGGAAAMTATAGGAGAAAGGGALSTAGGAGAKAAAAKLMTIVAVAGGATGTGYVAVHEVKQGHDAPAAVAEDAPPAAADQDAAKGEPIAQTTPLPPSAATPPTPAVSHATATTGAPRRKAAARRHRRAAAKRRHRRRASASLERGATAVAPVEERRSPLAADDDDGHKGKREKTEKTEKTAKDKSGKGKRTAVKQHPAHPHGGPPGQLKRRDAKRTPPGLIGKHNHGAEIHAKRQPRPADKPNVKPPGKPSDKPHGKPSEKPHGKPRLIDLPTPVPDQPPATPPLGSDTPSSTRFAQEDVATWPSSPES